MHPLPSPLCTESNLCYFVFIFQKQWEALIRRALCRASGQDPPRRGKRRKNWKDSENPEKNLNEALETNSTTNLQSNPDENPGANSEENPHQNPDLPDPNTGMPHKLLDYTMRCMKNVSEEVQHLLKS